MDKNDLYESYRANAMWNELKEINRNLRQQRGESDVSMMTPGEKDTATKITEGCLTIVSLVAALCAIAWIAFIIYVVYIE